ncbi:hypothetical protein [Hymenobacter psoromatis]|uniref:hypothetical protein n=1 Tax=Hymenobacter psoromatis TaxID=1484116 RepID=UPI001CBF602F|nr:hypothetical protein [Hymenobacter psoromatis]
MLKKTLLSFFVLIGFSYTVQAQANLIRLGINSVFLAKRLNNKNAPAPEKDAKPEVTTTTAASSLPTSASSAYEGQPFPMQRTATDQLPKKGAEQVVAMEAELDRCHAALLASPTGVICTPAQRAALQTAIMNLARTSSSRNLAAYQQEAAFYVAQDTRRQQPATPAAPAN